MIAWLSGVGGAVSSCSALAYYSRPRPIHVATTAAASASATTSAAPIVAQLPSTDEQAEILFDTLDRFRTRRIPLAAANLMLSIALLGGAARTMARRAGARAWLQQVCAATALFAAVEFVVAMPERDYLAQRLELVVHPSGAAAVTAAVRFKALAIAIAEVVFFPALAFILSTPGALIELAPRESLSPPPSRDDDDGDDLE